MPITTIDIPPTFPDSQAPFEPLTPVQRERLHAQISLAGDVVAPNWPIHTFISRNPLSGFEAMTFDMAVRRAHELFGGTGLLSQDEFRALYRQGRILESDLKAALEKVWPSASDGAGLHVGGGVITPAAVLMVHFLYGLNGLHPHLYPWMVHHESAFDRLRPDLPEDTKRRLRQRVGSHIERTVRRGEVSTTVAGRLAEMTSLDVLQWVQAGILHDLRESSGAGSSHQGEAHLSEKDRAVNGHDQGQGQQASAIPPLLKGSVRDEKAYWQALRTEFDRFTDRHRCPALSFPEFASCWMTYESRYLSALTLYLCGRSGGLETFRNGEIDPEGWYLKCLWLSVLQAMHLSDPHLPDSLTALFPRSGQASRPTKGTELGAISLAFIRPLSEWVGDLSGEDVVGLINDYMTRWCNGFFDQGLSSWTMPERQRGFYQAWKALAGRDYSLSLRGMGSMRQLIDRWPDHPADAVVVSLRRLAIPEDQWEEYFRRHLAQLPGWVGYIRWRTQNPDHPAQQACPIDLVQYLAVRLFYEAALTETVCRRHWGIPGSLGSLDWYSQAHPYMLRGTHDRQYGPLERVCDEAWRVFHLAQFMEWWPQDLLGLGPSGMEDVLGWLDRFPEEMQGLIWQEAYEAHYRHRLFSSLALSPSAPENAPSHSGRAGDDSVTPNPQSRPQAQAVFCIDVRSEPLRRHLEAQGPYETIGFAGFFGIPICYQALKSEEQAALCPVLIKPKNMVREIPRPGQEDRSRRLSLGMRWAHFGHQLFHDLKSHPITSFFLIDVLGWMFGLALIGKTLFPVAHARLLSWMKKRIEPEVSTQIPVDKLTKEEAERCLDEWERETILSFLQQSPQWRSIAGRVRPETVEALRRQALRVRSSRQEPAPEFEGPEASCLASLDFSPEQWRWLIEDLGTQCGITRANRDAQLDRLSTQGFTLTEQVFMVERALQLTGLTQRFGRIVLVCGHGSQTENNPYGSAYDCGACGGNHGGPNARVLAAMANNGPLRDRLRDRGIEIPQDTWFLAGEHNTTTDRVMLFDLEDVPDSHRPDVERLTRDLWAASLRLAEERCRRLPGAPQHADPAVALRHTTRRSVDWAQIRPEWGLSGNAAFIIGRRKMSERLDLGGRTFLHNYEASQDQSGKVLETIMTAPLVVAEWINLQYFFSAVDPWVYSSGSKVLHNVVSGVGVMLGSQADFQAGLPLQTVRDGTRLFHEPLRLTVIIQAPPEKISEIIKQHTILQHFFNHGWLLLVAADPESSALFEYHSSGDWRPLTGVPGGEWRG